MKMINISATLTTIISIFLLSFSPFVTADTTRLSFQLQNFSYTNYAGCKIAMGGQYKTLYAPPGGGHAEGALNFNPAPNASTPTTIRCRYILTDAHPIAQGIFEINRTKSWGGVKGDWVTVCNSYTDCALFSSGTQYIVMKNCSDYPGSCR